MLEANTHAARARATATRTVWRTLYLQARIARWLRDDYARKRKEEAAQQQEKELRRLLLEEQGGVLARAEKDGGVTGLKFYDASRALGLHRMAVELVAEDARRGKADLAAVQKCLEGTLAFCERMGPAGADIDRAGECALAAAGAAEAAQPLLSDPPAAGWTGAVEKVEALGRKALAKEYPLPAPYARLARLLLREARLAGQRGEMARSSKLNDDAGRWIEDGLRLGRAAKFTDAELAELRALAAERDRSREGLK